MKFALLLSLLLLSRGIHAQGLYNAKTFIGKRLVYGEPDDVIRSKADQTLNGAVQRLGRFWTQELSSAVMNSGNIEHAISKKCKAAYKKIANATDKGGFPLLANMADAWGKPGAGILEGNTYAYGSFDQCLNGELLQYCIGNVNTTLSSLFSLQLAMCVPKACTADDLATVINDTPLLVTNASTIFCTLEQKQPFSAGAIVMLVVSGLFIVVVLGATAFHLVLMCTENSCTEKVKVFDLLTAWSLYKTVPVILSTKQPATAIACVNGLRVISIFWVMLGHTHFNWTFITAADNLKYIIFSVGRRFSYQALLNAFLSVDSFFFLSGLLVAYLTLREMSRRKPGFKRFPILVYYIHRFLRLTPAYAFVLFGFWFLSPHLGNGPLYVQSTGINSSQYNNCVKYWWTNLLFFNNMYPWKLADECMPWTWYLANDMQFYIVAPLIVIPLFVHFAFGLAVVAIFLAVSFASTAGLVGAFNFQASQFAPFIYNYTEGEYTSNDLLYDKPYYRITPYLVGIVLGYLIYRTAHLSFGPLKNLVAYAALWVIASCACIGCLYGLYPVVHNNPPSLKPQNVTTYIPSIAENIFYITFSRCVWGVGLALLVFCCHNGYGGWVNKFLSLEIWVPLSRLTFMAYLVNPIVLTSFYGSFRTPVHYNDTTLAIFAIGNTVLSFGAAFVLAVFVEFPLGNLEMAIFKLFGVSRRESARHATEAKTKHQPE